MRYRAHLICLAIVALWGMFAIAWMGVEDGSSGSSPATWIQIGFLLPGIILMKLFNDGSHTNSDIPMIFVTSWVICSLISVAVTQVVKGIRRSGSTGTKGPSEPTAST
ncbi:MAG: hypothetical protein KDA93_25420 [Planctomycetaceae bacterium]|nr:hypothetical protein [Planctomycetaceae bacterium]